MVAAQSSAICKTRGAFPCFQSIFVYSLYNVVFDIVTVSEFLQIFVAFESCNWFVFKTFFSNNFTNVWQKSVIWYCEVNPCSYWRVFFVPLIGSFLSSFSTVLMCLSSSSELKPCLRNRCLSSLQWCSKSFDVVQICLIRSVWLYGILSFNDFECSEFMWRNLCRSVCFLYILV